MRCKQLIWLVPILMFLASCGAADNDADTQEQIEAIAISDSTWHGLAFTAQNIDASVKSSRIYYYDFAQGIVRLMASGESGDAAVFWVDDRLHVFNRQQGTINYRSLDPRQVEPPSEPKTLSGILEGDPWDVVSREKGRSLFLAAPFSAQLLTLDIASGNVAKAEVGSLATTSVQPVALMRQSNNLYLLHSGIKMARSGAMTFEATGTQQLYSFTIGSDLSHTPRDLDPSTPNVINGLALSASHPAGIFSQDGQTATVVGLCGSGWSSCVAAADTISLPTPTSNGSRASLWQGADFANYAVHQIIEGPSPTVIYAHVQGKSDNLYKVVRLDLATKAVSTIHTFPDGLLYGIAYDKSSKTLFVGDKKDLKGQLTLYRNDTLLGSVTLSSVLYKSALVSK